MGGEVSIEYSKYLGTVSSGYSDDIDFLYHGNISVQK